MSGDERTPLAGRRAVVTGASRGIGLACAQRLAAAGARVVLMARNAAALDDCVRGIGPGAAAVAVDLAESAEVRRAVPEIRRWLDGDADLLVNNAGIFPLARIEETSDDLLAQTLATNLTAPFLLTRELLPGMRVANRGDIVTIGSIADRVTFPENGAYAASKFGARALHQVLRAELAGSGIRATLVSPGPVDTAAWDVVDPDNRPGFTPRAQMLRPEAVADAVLWAVTRPADVNIDELRLSHS